MINHLRMHSQVACYATAMSPPVAQQIMSSIRIIMGEDGTGQGRKRLDQLLRNTRYFRHKLQQLGLIVYTAMAILQLCSSHALDASKMRVCLNTLNIYISSL